MKNLFYLLFCSNLHINCVVRIVSSFRLSFLLVDFYCFTVQMQFTVAYRQILKNLNRLTGLIWPVGCEFVPWSLLWQNIQYTFYHLHIPSIVSFKKQNFLIHKPQYKPFLTFYQKKALWKLLTKWITLICGKKWLFIALNLIFNCVTHTKKEDSKSHWNKTMCTRGK